ncbi:MAG: hypothetical protein HGA67_03730 [Candidatus Yonathbacteria bacterium]|nr:hypothetical protein [Candidatus Yonathbacteria bacterium]
MHLRAPSLRAVAALSLAVAILFQGPAAVFASDALFTVATSDAFSIEHDSASVSCVRGGDTTDVVYTVMWGTTDVSEHETPVAPVSPGADILQVSLSGLSPNTTYTYQCVATRDAVSITGGTSSFTTKAYGPTVFSITHESKEIHAGDTVARDDFPGRNTPTSAWSIDMYWPHAVVNQNTFIALIRGDFGAIDGGIPIAYGNYYAQLQSWGEGENIITKMLGMCVYKDNDVPQDFGIRMASGRYTLLVAERTGSFIDQPDATIMDWFASGGTSGTAPKAFAMIPFTYDDMSGPGTTLSYLSGAHYADDQVLEGRGVYPNKGVADTDTLTFKTVYTDIGNVPPAYVRTEVHSESAGGDTSGDIFLEMMPDTGAEIPAALTDGRYDNGEAYAVSRTFPKGKYTYTFLAKGSAAGAQEFAFPEPAPTSPLSFTTGYSSVAFLPGIGGSRLYTQYGNGEMVWEPNDLVDAAQIRLDKTTHESNDPSIVVSGITDEVFLRLDAWPMTNVYKTFMEFMDTQVVGQGVIKEWKPLAYDWRLGLDALISRGEILGTKNGSDIISYEANTARTERPYLIEELRKLAENSDSGKVSLVTHSNGGLVAKYILKHLVDTHDPLLERIDTVVLVASPQLGTPEAVVTLLHGTTKVGKGVERNTAETLPSAYHLLPSQEYFHTVSTPILEFSPQLTTIPQLVDFAGKTIAGSNAYTTLKDFMTGHGGAWTEPSFLDLNTPNILDNGLLSYAETMHTTLDTWVPPANIRMVQIAGWGLDTIRGIEYDNCDIPLCPQNLLTLNRHLLKTTLGDGTVVLPSAIAMEHDAGVETYYLNFNGYNSFRRIDRKHSSVLEVKDLQKFLKQIIGSTQEDFDYISSSQPIATDDFKDIRFIMHSPVAMHLYDANGNHTGIIPNPNPLSDIRVYEENIPNSYYEEFGETKYIGANTNTPITLKLIGEGTGTFTLEVEETHGDIQIGYTVFTNIPVVKGSAGSITISTISDVGVLMLDNNGDGISDVYAFTDEMKGVIDYDILKEAIKGLKSNQSSVLAIQVEVIKKLHDRGNVIAEKVALLAFKKQIEVLTGSKISAKMQVSKEEYVKVSAFIDILVGNIEQPVKERKDMIQKKILELKERLRGLLRR